MLRVFDPRAQLTPVQVSPITPTLGKRGNQMALTGVQALYLVRTERSDTLRKTELGAWYCLPAV